MKKMLAFIAAITILFTVTAALEPVYATNNKYTVTFSAFFDNENITDVDPIIIADVSYGTQVSLDTGFEGLSADYAFAFWLLNGAVRNTLREDHQFFVTGNLTIDAIYSKVDPITHAVVFMDSNSKKIEVAYVLDGETIAEPVRDYGTFTKPNYVVQDQPTRWNDSLENVTASGVRILQYEIDEASVYSVTAHEATVVTPPNGADDHFIFNTIVTVEAHEPRDGEKFSHFQIAGQVVSYDTVYSFTVLRNTTVSAVYVLESETVVKEPIVMIREVALRDGQQSFVGQFYIPAGHTLGDYGVLRSTEAIETDLDFDNDDQRLGGYKYVGETREFLVTFSTEVKHVRMYLVTENGEGLKTVLSRQINYALFGEGTEENPYEISNFNHLDDIRDNLDAYFVLTADLNDETDGFAALAGPYANGGLGWEPIGSTLEDRFIGIFDGQGHTIDGLTIDRPDTDNVGLFGHIGVSATSSDPTVIKNVCLTNVDIIGNRGTGALVGRVTGNQFTLIEYTCAVGGSVKGTGATGGLVGSLNSFTTSGAADRNPVLDRSFASVDVYGEDRDAGRTYEKFGGLVGCSQKGRILNSYALGSVTVDDALRAATRVGSLTGCNVFRGFLRSSYGVGAVSAPNSTSVGGLIGNTSTEGGHVPVDNAYWNTATTGLSDGIGTGDSGGSIIGLTTNEMQGAVAATNMDNLDFTNVWQTTSKYPILQGAEWFVNRQLAAQDATLPEE